jgi:hypothetical protein
LFVHWIETRFHDAWPVDLDPDLATCLEAAHMNMLDDIPAWQLRLQMKHLVNLWMHQPTENDMDKPRQPPTVARDPHTRMRLHPIEMQFQALGAEEQQRNTWRFTASPRQGVPSAKGPYYVVHLYSGRCRPNDFHDMMDRVLRSLPAVQVRVLSIDTAVDPTLNVRDHRLWHFLMSIAHEGRLLGLLQGPPCETWTAARHNEQRDPDGTLIRGPRPLRAADNLWGLSHLTCGELAQIFTGNSLLLKGMLPAVVVTVRGGATFLEHPAVPFEESYPSIWRTGLLKLLQRAPAGPFRITIKQWRYGAESVKPTTLLYSNSRLPHALESCKLDGAVRPQKHLIGKALDGSYRTAAAKEYPAALNEAFAHALKGVLLSHANPFCESDEPFGIELANIASSTKYGCIKPDYQPTYG